MRNLRVRPLLLATLAIGSVVACAPARPAPGAIAPATTRATNADLEADLRTMDRWEARRAVLLREEALIGFGSARAADLATAGSWLAFAREAYVAQRRSPAADEAFAEARRLIEQSERAATVATKPVTSPASATPAVHSSAAAADYPALWARTRALAGDNHGTYIRQLVAAVEVELARAAVAGERDSATVATELASRGSGLPSGVPMRLAAVRGGSNAACPLAPHLDRAQQLLADAEQRVRDRLLALQADSARKAAMQAQLAFLADVRADARVRTRAVHFALNKDSLSAASRALLDKVSGALKEHPGLVVVLEGHTDPRGSAAYNLDLSRRRASAVHRYLEGTGLDVSRIEVKGFGLAARRTLGTTAQAYAMDRRVLVRFSMEDGTPLAETDEMLDLQIEEARRAARREGTPVRVTTQRTAMPRTAPPRMAAKRTTTARPAAKRTTTKQTGRQR
jgi:outer membrane protein OmpA-like peptidoglycan-associated protein